MQIPNGHQAIMPYFILHGAPAFMDFTKKVFDANVTATHYREDNTSVMHAEVMIGNQTIMFAEATEQYPPATGNLFIYVDDADTTFQKALKEGAAVVLELKDQPYGRSGGISDPFGNVWWITSAQ